MRILAIDTDHKTLKSIELMFNSEGFSIEATSNSEDALYLAKLEEFDLIVLDPKLKTDDGKEILSVIRQSKISTPVMILSYNSDVRAKVEMFGYGCDDYIVKPFNKDELIARTQAIIRRSKGQSHSHIQIGERISLNLSDNTAYVDGKALHLTQKEYEMFEILCLRRNQTISKDAFLGALYGGRDEPELKIIDVFICKLRKKLEEACGGERYIETIWGRGYTMRDAPIAIVDKDYKIEKEKRQLNSSIILKAFRQKDHALTIKQLSETTTIGEMGLRITVSSLLKKKFVIEGKPIVYMGGKKRKIKTFELTPRGKEHSDSLSGE